MRNLIGGTPCSQRNSTVTQLHPYLVLTALPGAAASKHVATYSWHKVTAPQSHSLPFNNEQQCHLQHSKQLFNRTITETNTAINFIVLCARTFPHKAQYSYIFECILINVRLAQKSSLFIVIKQNYNYRICNQHRNGPWVPGISRRLQCKIEKPQPVSISPQLTAEVCHCDTKTKAHTKAVSAVLIPEHIKCEIKLKTWAYILVPRNHWKWMEQQ